MSPCQRDTVDMVLGAAMGPALLSLLLGFSGCAAAPVVVTKTVTVDVPVEKLVAVPPEYTADCPTNPLTGATIGAILERLASVEAAWANCREQIALIRELGPGAPPAK